MTDLTPEQKLIVYALNHGLNEALDFAGIKEHPLFPRDAWVAAVIAGTTDAAYNAWVANNNVKVYDEIEEAQRKPVKPKAIMKASASFPNRYVRPIPEASEMTTAQLRKIIDEFGPGDEA